MAASLAGGWYRGRGSTAETLFAKFREEDVLAKKLVTSGAALKNVFKSKLAMNDGFSGKQLSFSMIMKQTLTLLTALLLAPLVALHAADHDLFMNEDAWHYFVAAPEVKRGHVDADAPVMRPQFTLTKKGLESYIDEIARGHLTHFVMNLNSQRANFPSKTLEPLWKSLDEPERDHLDYIRAMKALYENGVDPYKVWIDRCRVKGIQPWISIRMNDMHRWDEPKSPNISTFWHEHAEYRLRPEAWDNGLDYTLEPVRKRMLDFITEVLDRYDPEGLEIDLMRFRRYLPIGREKECAPIFTAYMREVRKVANAAAAKRGHTITLSVRLSSKPSESRKLGMEADIWAKEGIVDVIVPTSPWESIDFDIPLAEWRTWTSDRVPIIPSADDGITENGKRRIATFEEYRRWASIMHERGAKGLYLFNLFLHPQDGPVWNGVLSGGLAPLAALHGAEPPRTLRAVHAPLWVGRPPSDAVSGLVRLENGELRHYDYGIDPTPELRFHPNFLPTSYVYSRDQGLTWETQKVSKGHYGADARSPISGEYLRLQDNKDGVYLIKSKGGMAGEWTMRRLWEITKPGSEHHITPTVMFIRGGKRAIVPWSLIRYNTPEHHHQAGVLFSDDDGETWQRSNLLEAPPHQPDQRDRSVRWQNGATEPTVVELRDGRLWMIIRTSLDYHYQSFSADGGATWSQPERSPFYGTLTSPRIGRLKDGRLLFIWNNTTSLPEFPKNEFTAPFIQESAQNGIGEDVFTNRDAVHAAISDDDGKTWRGFRELFLNTRRNDGNYGETGGLDRSVHQPQFVEVENGRVVLSVGQHWLHRSLFVFDPSWLLETKRQCDFANGLDDWSVQGYKKGIRGHCSFNRYESSTLVPHPEDAKRRVLNVRNSSRTDAIFPRGGATWNFPGGRAGFVEMRIRLQQDFGGARLCLLDRWLNPTDPTVASLAMGHLDLASGGKLKPQQWHTLRFTWKSAEAGAEIAVTLDGQPFAKLPVTRSALHGISYVHFQSTSANRDSGLLIESVRAEVTQP